MHTPALSRPVSRRRAFRPGLLSAGLLALALALTGCYTQLATRGYGAADAPAYGQAPMDSAARAAADSALAAREADTLAPQGAPAVVVNHYYDVGPSHRGYAHWAWDHPSFYIGYYSSGYNRYSRPWWWDDHRYSRHWHGHRHRHGGRSGHHGGGSWSGSGGGGSSGGDVTGGGRLHNPETTYPEVRKGRRAPDPTPAPAPKKSDDGGSSSSGSSSGSSSSSSSNSGSNASSSSDEKKNDDGYRTLRKGKRR